MKDRKRQEKTSFQKFDRLMPGLILQKYSCEFCESFTASSSLPFFKALSLHSDHNKQQHPREFPAPRTMMVYKT